MIHRHRKIVVVGASGGIGRELISHMLDDGYRDIIGTYRTFPKQPLAYVSDDNLRMVYVEPTSAEDYDRVLDLSMDAWALINLAGASHPAPSFKRAATEAMVNAINDNLFTTMEMCMRFAAQMRARNTGGRIINVSSVVAHRPVFGASAYATAKAAVEGYTKALAWEVGNKNITANTIALGYFHAGMGLKIDSHESKAIINEQAIERFGTVRELFGLIDYLISDLGGFMTGQTLHLNGGLR